MSETKVKNAEKKTAKARLREIELKKAEVELRSLKADLELDEIRLIGYREERRRKDNEDKNLGIFSLDSSVGNGSVAMASEIRAWGRAHPGSPVTLNVFSPGGSVFHGLVLYDTLRGMSNRGHHITTIARGMAASMGSLIFLAGDVRIVGSQALVMFHGMTAGTGGDLYSMKEDIAFYDRLEKRMDEILFERTKVTPELLAKKTKKKDWWLHADECLKLKVAHEVE